MAALLLFTLLATALVILGPAVVLNLVDLVEVADATTLAGVLPCGG